MIEIGSNSIQQQYSSTDFNRELNKIYCAIKQIAMHFKNWLVLKKQGFE